MAKPELTVVVLGDSAMWGQGLREEDKFAFKTVQELGKVLGREARIAINTARSGAPIRAGRTTEEAKQKRQAFVDTYPSMFNSPALKENFIERNIQEVALLLPGEIPAPFPTISYQVQRVQESVAQTTELVLLDGGANDLDFETFLNPEEQRSTFVQHYDPQLEEISYLRVKSLLRQAREKFPQAVIVYTGYFAPFAPEVSNGALEQLFEHESGAPSWAVALFSNNIIDIKNIDQLVREAQLRAQFGVARGLYWTRKAIAEINADPKLRGPGVLFVHPQFGPENTVFAANSFFHREYELSKVKDAVRSIREAQCPRLALADEMEKLLRRLMSDFVSKETAQSLLKKLDGPQALQEALGRLAETPGDASDRVDVIVALVSDLKRINHVRRASFVHPNEKGAQRFTNVIVKRYTERYQRIRLRDDLRQLQKPGAGGKPAGLRRSLRRYGLGSLTSVRTMTPLLLVDSIALEVTTADNSEADMFDDIFLNLGGEHRWQLNFPYRVIPPSSNGLQPVFLKILHSQFEPGATDLFTIDARGIHLGSITQFTIERRVSPVVKTFAKGLLADFSNGEWKPSKITLYINGMEVFSVPFFGNLTRNGTLTFPYPR